MLVMRDVCFGESSRILRLQEIFLHHVRLVCAALDLDEIDLYSYSIHMKLVCATHDLDEMSLCWYATQTRTIPESSDQMFALWILCETKGAMAKLREHTFESEICCFCRRNLHN